MKLIARLSVAIYCVVSPLAALAQTPLLLRTFNNPTPAIDDNFGSSMAALGNDRVLVGAPYDDTGATNAGAVYLFHTNGTLLTTFTNPNPAFNTYLGSDRFGTAVAAVGSDRVLIGAPNETRAYLFTTNGVLVATMESPHSINDPFGSVVAAFGNDRALIGTSEYSSDPEAGVASGMAYLYNTNGTLLAFLDNPEPSNVDLHGFSLAPFGSDRVIIGAPGRGVVRLFSTNGTLLTTITNPTPAALPDDDYFGHSVAAVGADRLLVGAPYDDTAATNAGSVYLFNTNGTLLLTITNPAPAADDNFGSRMAMLGTDRVIIGAPGDDATGTNAGAAYVFSVNGILLATLNNPTPASDDHFGSHLAAFGSDGALIGAQEDDAGATNAGSAYFFSIPLAPAPLSLAIRWTATNSIVVSWPSSATGFVLQQNTNALNSLSWSNITSGIQDDGTNKTLIVNPPAGSRFYRLKNP